jgi:hypothetical protein
MATDGLIEMNSCVYFSGLIPTFDYIACVPGHEAGCGNPAMNDVLDILGKCFRKPYLLDLVVRHTTAPKSQQLRLEGKEPDPRTQLNTIRITRFPLKAPPNQRYSARSWKLQGKSILLLDDICTNGYTFGAAKAFLEQAGAQVLLVSWLKTINRAYYIIGVNKPFDPYVAQSFTAKDLTRRPLIYTNKWLQVLGTTETPHIDQGVCHQFHSVVALLDVLETEEQPLEFVLPRKRPL